MEGNCRNHVIEQQTARGSDLERKKRHTMRMRGGDRTSEGISNETKLQNQFGTKVSTYFLIETRSRDGTERRKEDFKTDRKVFP